MKLVRQLLESLILAFAVAVVVFVFHHFGGFTFQASLLLGVCFPGILKFSTDWGDPRTGIGWLPRFMFRPGWKGFELSVQVVREWWSEYKRFLSPGMQNLPVNYDGFVVLAHLPYGYIPDHVRRYFEPISLFYPFDIMHRSWRSKLSEHGWTVNEPDEEISSRYLIVRYRSIWPNS